MRAIAAVTPDEEPLAQAIRATLEALRIKTTDYAPGAEQVMIVGLPARDTDARALAHTLHERAQGWAATFVTARGTAAIVSTAGKKAPTCSVR